MVSVEAKEWILYKKVLRNLGWIRYIAHKQTDMESHSTSLIQMTLSHPIPITAQLLIWQHPVLTYIPHCPIVDTATCPVLVWLLRMWLEPLHSTCLCITPHLLKSQTFSKK